MNVVALLSSIHIVSVSLHAWMGLINMKLGILLLDYELWTMFHYWILCVLIKRCTIDDIWIINKIKIYNNNRRYAISPEYSNLNVDLPVNGLMVQIVVTTSHYYDIVFVH